MHKEDVRAPRRGAVCGMAAAAMAAVVGGCQTYEPAPLDLSTHRAGWNLRAAEVEPLTAFAERLSAGDAAPPRFDLSDGVSPAEGEVMALFFNPALRVARAEAGVALANRETAGLWADPVFGFDGADIISSAAASTYGLTLAQAIPISGRLRLERERADAAYEAALRQVVAAEWSTRAEMRRAWAAWAAARERADLLGEVLSQAERVGATAAALETAGELSRVESRLFRLELAERRAALAAAERDAERARVVVLAMLGLPPGAAMDLELALPAAAPPRVEDELARLIEANVELAVHRADYRLAEETLRLEIRAQYPDIVLGGGYGSEDGDQRLLLGLSVPIPINANRAGIAEARARREVARTAARATFERLAYELAAAEADLAAAQAQLEIYTSEVLPLVAEQSAEAERLAELGEVDALLLLEAVRRQYETRARLLELRLAELEAAISIAELLGPDGALVPAPVEGDPGEASVGEQTNDNQSSAGADATAEGGAR